MDISALGSWQELLADVLNSGDFSELSRKIDEEYENNIIFPPKDQVFTAFSLTPPERVRVVILGQDPYHNDGQAEGLCFSVKKGVEMMAPPITATATLVATRFISLIFLF